MSSFPAGNEVYGKSIESLILAGNELAPSLTESRSSITWYDCPSILDEDDYGFLDHIYTFNLPQVYDMIHQFNDVISEFESVDGFDRWGYWCHNDQLLILPPTWKMVH